MVKFSKLKDISKYMGSDVMRIDIGEKIIALKNFTTYNVNKRLGYKYKGKSGLSNIKKGDVGICMGLSGVTSLTYAHVFRFGRNFVYIYDYDFKEKRRVRGLKSQY